jgi:hypothetical protein
MISKGKVIQERRDFLKLSLITATYLLVGCGNGGGSSNNTINNETNKDGLIINATLNIPPLINPEVDSNGIKNIIYQYKKQLIIFIKIKLQIHLASIKVI